MHRNLLGNHGLLHAGEERLALGQGEAEGRVHERHPHKGGDFCHDRRPITGFDDHLHRDLHQRTSDIVRIRRNCRLMARRSQRLTAAQYCRVRSSSYGS